MTGLTTAFVVVSVPGQQIPLRVNSEAGNRPSVSQQIDVYLDVRQSEFARHQ